MKETKLISKERGITLIALVITIIILLILAGVTLRIVLSENGLFKIATQSSETSKDVAEEERVKLAVSGAFLDGVGNLTKENVKKALESEFGELDDGQLEGADTGPWTFVGDRKTYTIESSGGIQELKPKTVADLKAGDWVIYESAIGSMPCRVLYDEEYNKNNETNYGIQIISNDTYGEATFGSNDTNAMLDTIASLRSALSKLNKEAKSYTKPDDKFLSYSHAARCAGSDPSFTVYDVNQASHQADEHCYFRYLAPEKMDGNKFENFIDADFRWEKDFHQMNKLGLLKPGNELAYWLGSFPNPTYRDSYVVLGYVAPFIWNEDITDSWDGFDIWDGSSSCEKYMLMSVECDGEWTNEITNGIRPVFQLKPEVVLSKGDGQTKETAYILSAN